MKILIVGGVAGGASAAARARRLSEDAEIIMFERGEFISFANCGLPYHVGNVIPERDSLLLMTPESFRQRTNIEVRTRQEVMAIHRDRRTVAVQKLETGQVYEEPYDKLILATGSRPARPPIPGSDDPDVLTLWTIPDMDRIISAIRAEAKDAVVIGGGFIGLEVAENLQMRGLQVHLIEMLPQVLPTFDREMAAPLAAQLRGHGIDLHLGAAVTAIERPAEGHVTAGRLRVTTDTGTELAADFVVMAIGIRPNAELAEAAGLTLSGTGGVEVDAAMRTSDPDIYAVGDVAAVQSLVSGQPAQIPLAGPANRQGRIAAEQIFGRESTYRGSLGTSVVKVFELTAASAGLSERALDKAGIAHEKVYLHPSSNAAYYPGARPLSIKLLFDRDGCILGVQALGEKGVARRIDVIATAMRGGQTVYDLEELELAYAPPYGSAKDPVNFSGMIAANVLRGDSSVVHRTTLPEEALLLDVREPEEYELGHIDQALSIPLGTLRERLDELPRDRFIVAYCKVGLRGYLAERILKEHGFTCGNLSGGFTTWQLQEPPSESSSLNARTAARPAASLSAEGGRGGSLPPGEARTLDVRALQCPGPIVRVRRELEAMDAGEALIVQGLPGFEADLSAWCRVAGHAIVALEQVGDHFVAQVQKGGTPSAGNRTQRPDSATIVCFSSDLDKVMAAFIIATGMASLGCRVNMFFTFWGLNVLRKPNPPSVVKDLLSRMFGFLMPRGAHKLALSKLHMLGMGTAMMTHVMKKKNVANLPELIGEARALGVKFIACDMAMNVMGLQREELLESVDEVAGVASFAALAKEGGTTLFV